MKNSVALIGRVGQDVEVKVFNDGNKIANFSLATSEKYTDRNGEKQESTQWHRIVAKKKSADVCEKYVKKGDLLSVDGKIVYRSWETDSGEKRYSTDIETFNVTMLGQRSSDPLQGATPVEQSNGKASGEEVDDLPF